jgi:adenine specific DNA methylase Mod
MLLPTTKQGDTVLDPFAGSGTTGEVAADMGRKAILIESSPAGQVALTDRVAQTVGKLFY